MADARERLKQAREKKHKDFSDWIKTKAIRVDEDIDSQRVRTLLWDAFDQGWHSHIEFMRLEAKGDG